MFRRKRKIEQLRAETLAAEATWLATAHSNSGGHGYSEQYRQGFAAAAGWVRLHAEFPHLIRDRHPEGA